ncbi:MAG: DNA recombination protein RmuC [Rhodospirillaceae bacterium]|nr:DNA recombination protein RmuC [Rhodospirillaceae bacterium]MBT5242312.1 DNA recombination protein RmuC [Rhodospirillaceae bacterium]MBT5566040.1 DNA recombination protein RmuC [Rhodospirillaceae bacterium]MBT6089006.1 DNA recombination protein RmuC [Rhodospirillaceae bacterium]MBT7450631.1 DNA recombination protein RmuC [Rhodospirillaceae bacterium]
MNFLTDFGVTTGEFALGLMLLVVLILGVLIAIRSSKPDGAAAQNMTTLIESLTKMSSDQAELRGQISQIAASQETGRKLVAEQLQAQEREIGKTLNERLEKVTQRVGESIQKTTDKTTESLTDLQKRLAVIDAAQKNIADLSTDIVGLQDILSNKQARGAFGQAQMEDIVRDMLPADYFKFEATLSNGKRVDCLITLPGDQGDIGVDSKYPHEGFVRLMEAKNDEERKTAGQIFTRDVIKHVQAIAEKYIIPGETSDWALMFVPAESIYMELHTNFQNVIQEGYRRKIIIASPSSFWAILHSVRALIRDTKMREHAGIIQKEVGLLMEDVARLDKRVGNLGRHFEQSGKDIEDIQKSTRKIALHGNRIKQVDLQGEADNGPADLPADGEASVTNLESRRTLL